MSMTREPAAWTTVTVSATDRLSAIAAAISGERKAGRRVRETASATPVSRRARSKRHGVKGRWVVEVRVDPADITKDRAGASAATPDPSPVGNADPGEPIPAPPDEVAPSPASKESPSASAAARRGDERGRDTNDSET